MDIYKRELSGACNEQHLSSNAMAIGWGHLKAGITPIHSNSKGLHAETAHSVPLRKGIDYMLPSPISDIGHSKPLSLRTRGKGFSRSGRI
jgi:hypothetical protein